MGWLYQPHPSLRDELAGWRTEKFNARLDDFEARQPGYRDKIGEFVTLLEQHSPTGRAEIVIGYFDSRLDALIEDGTLWTGTVEHEPMQPSRCHDNTTDFLRAMPGWRVWSGYARDGIEWRAHSCPVSPDLTRMVETTGMRDTYVGIVLSGAEFDAVEC